MSKSSKEVKLRIMMPILHFLIAIVCSHSFFGKLVTDTGIENVTYDAGIVASLAEDVFSVWLCKGTAYVLAAVVVYYFWQFIFKYAGSIACNKKTALLVGGCLVAGIILVLTLYPANWGVETTDDYMNYAYAKEFLPMYWHGFVTNVLYCTCLILIPHPTAISVIQLFLGVGAFLYMGKGILKKITTGGIKTNVAVIAVAFISIICIPELLRILLYPTRNCMYAILSMWFLGILFSDYVQNRVLTKERYILLVCLTAFLAVWRGEGILYAVAFPFLIFFAYRLKVRQVLSKHGVLGLLFFIVVCVLISLPDKYGVNKYQNSDYMIANTTGPLSAVLHDSNANLTYKNAKEDLEKIAQVIPLEYIERYGCNGGFYFNAISGRWPRQHGVSEEVGKAYVTSAYRILLYNLPTYLKYQTNLFIRSNYLKINIFDIKYGTEVLEDAAKLKPYVRAYELYDAGEADLKDYSLWESRYGESVETKITEIYTVLRKHISVLKMFMLALSVVILVVSFCKKEYLFTTVFLLNLGMLTVVILMAPAVRANYYYSVFLNTYLCLVCYVVVRIKTRIERTA